MQCGCTEFNTEVSYFNSFAWIHPVMFSPSYIYTVVEIDLCAYETGNPSILGSLFGVLFHTKSDSLPVKSESIELLQIRSMEIWVKLQSIVCEMHGRMNSGRADQLKDGSQPDTI